MFVVSHYMGNVNMVVLRSPWFDLFPRLTVLLVPEETLQVSHFSSQQSCNECPSVPWLVMNASYY